MGCVYSEFDGTCSLYTPDFENPGCDDEGYCICEEDPDPSMLCEEYESDGCED